MCGRKQTNQLPSRIPASGFTLIEVLVVVTLTVMILLAASALFMTSLLSNARTVSNQLIKNEGSYALDQMTFLIRNAIDVLPNGETPAVTCGANMTELVIKSLDGGVTTLEAIPDPADANVIKIASTSGTKSQFFTSKAVSITSGPTFNCAQENAAAAPYITVEFELTKGTPNVDDAREVVQQTFKSSVYMRNL